MTYNQFLEQLMDFEHFLLPDSRQDLLSLRADSQGLSQDIELLPFAITPTSQVSSFGCFAQMEKIMDFMDILDLPEEEKPGKEGSKGKSYQKKSSIKSSTFETSLPPKGQKKVRKIQNSPFHNYQKHLNNALKKLVIVPTLQEADQAYKHAAKDIWTAYLQGEAKTKKVLHFVFNQRNEHQIRDSELKACGLLGVYKKHSPQIISQAKSYLSKLAIDQIDAANVQGYVKTRKMKKTEAFTDYVLNFRKELLGGYIKRRVQIEQIQF